MAISSCRRDVIVKRGTERRSLDSIRTPRSLAQNTTTRTFFRRRKAFPKKSTAERSAFRVSSIDPHHFESARAALPPPLSPSRPRNTMDVEALLEEDEDDVLEDIDMSQPVDSSQDLVDSGHDPVPSPAKSARPAGCPPRDAPARRLRRTRRRRASPRRTGTGVSGCRRTRWRWTRMRWRARKPTLSRRRTEVFLVPPFPTTFRTRRCATGTRSCLWNRRRFGWRSAYADAWTSPRNTSCVCSSPRSARRSRRGRCARRSARSRRTAGGDENGEPAENDDDPAAATRRTSDEDDVRPAEDIDMSDPGRGPQGR